MAASTQKDLFQTVDDALGTSAGFEKGPSVFK
jgi:hypothetical protein